MGHARAERHLLVPAVAEADVARRGRDRAHRAARLLGRGGAGLIAHWDDVPPDADLAQAAGAVAVSLRRIELAPGERVGLLRRRTEDVLYVVAGSGDGLRTGDCVVYPVPHEAPTLRAGDEGLTALLFATPAEPPPFHSGTPEEPRAINVGDAEAAYEGEAGRWVLLARQAGAQHAGVNF